MSGSDMTWRESDSDSENRKQLKKEMRCQRYLAFLTLCLSYNLIDRLAKFRGHNKTETGVITEDATKKNT